MVCITCLIALSRSASPDDAISLNRAIRPELSIQYCIAIRYDAGLHETKVCDGDLLGPLQFGIHTGRGRDRDRVGCDRVSCQVGSRQQDPKRRLAVKDAFDSPRSATRREGRFIENLQARDSAKGIQGLIERL